MRSFRVSCVFRIVRVKRSFVSFAFFVRLRLVRIVNLYDPRSVVQTCALPIWVKERMYIVLNIIANETNEKQTNASHER